MKKKYDVVFLDLDNTLFDFEACENIALDQTAQQFNIRNIEFFKESFIEINTALWKNLEKGLMTSQQIKLERFVQLMDRIPIQTNPQIISNYYLERLGEGINLFPYAREVCHFLKANYKVAAVTNGVKSVQMSRLEKSGLIDCFDAVIISEDIGASKPDTLIFDAAMNALNHREKSTVLMIGDSIEADINGAKIYGIDTCWVNLKGFEKPDHLDLNWEVNQLEQLMDIL